jgi:hypothetical protein
VDLTSTVSSGRSGPGEGDLTGAPKPNPVELPTPAAEPTMSPERRNKLRALALGKDESSSEDKQTSAANEVSPDRDDTQTTIRMEPPRVASVPPPASATAPQPNVVTATAAAEQNSEQEQADARMARMESSRQTVAQRHGVELSFESKDGKVSVYVRPKKPLTTTEREALRKSLRKELQLSDSDTLIFR